MEDLLRPIIDYVPTSVSPPPAPKHAVAPPTKVKKEPGGGKGGKDTATPSKPGPSSLGAAQARLSSVRPAKKRQLDSTPDPDTTRSLDDSSSPDAIDDASSSSRTPSPVPNVASSPVMGDGPMDRSLESAVSSAKKRSASLMEDASDYLARARGGSAVRTPEPTGPVLAGAAGSNLAMSYEGPEAYTDIVLNYFISETAQIPNILVTPPADYDPNTRIDEDGHTALHWACAMGRVRVVKLLLTAGASIFAANNAEQTPLMRSVMFSNNYDMRKFPELYELLHRSTLNIDRHNRTVFHHIANLALIKGKTHAARYYMETILIRLADFPQELADVINFQDEDGETALTLAARARSRRLVKSLLDHGADPKIKNRDLKSAEDYILEDERFRTSPVAPGRTGANGTRVPDIAHQLFSSEAARLAGGSCLADMTTHMQSLAKSFDAELASKERDILQAKALLTGIHAEVTEASRLLQTMQEQVGHAKSNAGLDEHKELEAARKELKAKVDARVNQGYAAWETAEVEKEGKVQSGQLQDEGVRKRLQPAGQEEEAQLRWQIEERRRKRHELLDEYVRAQAEAGTGEKVLQYRRLISAGLGQHSTVEDVEQVMDQLLAVSMPSGLLWSSLF